MYYPQSYHHIQEIQKYNIQDYRPRYATVHPSYPSNTFTDAVLEWSNSKKQSAKCGKYSECVSSAAMRSRRQTSRKPAYCKLTIPLESVEDMGRWQVQGQKADNENHGRSCINLGYSIVLFSLVFGRRDNLMAMWAGCKCYGC